MKSNLCRHCKHFHPKGTTARPYDVCNFMSLAANIQGLGECPAGGVQLSGQAGKMSSRKVREELDEAFEGKKY